MINENKYAGKGFRKNAEKNDGKKIKKKFI